MLPCARVLMCDTDIRTSKTQRFLPLYHTSSFNGTGNKMALSGYCYGLGRVRLGFQIVVCWKKGQFSIKGEGRKEAMGVKESEVSRIVHFEVE